MSALGLGRVKTPKLNYRAAVTSATDRDRGAELAGMPHAAHGASYGLSPRRKCAGGFLALSPIRAALALNLGGAGRDRLRDDFVDLGAGEGAGLSLSAPQSTPAPACKTEL
jgi:hypothetical protein